MAQIAFYPADLIAAGLDKLTADEILTILDEANYDVISMYEVEDMLLRVANAVGRSVPLRRRHGNPHDNGEWRYVSLLYVPPAKRGVKTFGFRPEENTFVFEVI